MTDCNILTNERCNNWPCAKDAGHAGPCSTSPEKLNLIEPVKFEDIHMSVIGNQNTVIIEDDFPYPAQEDGKARVWLTIDEARALRDWLNKALP
jgi:hypothetical protein